MTLVFPGAVIGGFSATGVEFDGADSLTIAAGPTGLADGKTGTLSVWIKKGTTTQRWLIYGGNVGRFRLSFLANSGTPQGLADLLGLGTTGAVVLNLRSTTRIDDDAWHHLLFAWDTATAANCLMYLDGVADTRLDTRVDANIDYASGQMWIGRANTGGTSHYIGDAAELWFTTEWLDISDSAVRAKFAKNGRPVFLGADGSKPSGTQPLLYFKGPASTWDTNLGSGGTFTASGTFTDAATKPSY